MNILQSITLTMLTGTVIALSGCNKAIATDTEHDTNLETVTRAGCLAKSSKDEKMLCLKQLATQNESELARLDDKLETGKARNDKLVQDNETMLEQFEEEVLGDSKPD